MGDKSEPKDRRLKTSYLKPFSTVLRFFTFFPLEDFLYLYLSRDIQMNITILRICAARFPLIGVAYKCYTRFSSLHRTIGLLVFPEFITVTS